MEASSIVCVGLFHIRLLLSNNCTIFAGHLSFGCTKSVGNEMEKKTILLTGCSEGGIGAALARALASRGHHVFATARNTSKIPQSLTSLANVTIVSLDVTSKPSIEEATKIITAALQAHGFRGLDVLVNNSGRGYTMPLLDVDVDEAKDVYDVNVFGTLRVIQAFSDLLIQAKGRVVNTPWIGRLNPQELSLTSHLFSPFFL